MRITIWHQAVASYAFSELDNSAPFPFENMDLALHPRVDILRSKKLRRYNSAG